MRYQRIDIIVLSQVILLALTPLLFSLSLGNDALVLTRIILVATWLFQIVLLYRYIRRSELSLKQAVGILKSGESYQTLGKSRMTKVHEDVLDEINTAIAIFREMKIENEANLLFFREVMENVPTAIIVIDEDEEIEFINSAAQILTGIASPGALKDLDKLRPDLSFWLREKRGGPNIIDINLPDRSLKLSVSARDILIRGEKRRRIFSLKDIKREVDTKEIETWHNMLRILSHEVVNSVSPITLSATSMRRNLSALKDRIVPGKESETIIQDIDSGLSAIGLRGAGLNDFVESVRKLTKIPAPDIEKIGIKQLVCESIDIMRLNLQENNIKLKEELDDISLCCDRKLISQVLINLVKNSMESFTEQKGNIIRICSTQNEDSVSLIIEDNGPGIPADIQSQIFSPFFSTKSEGSGLGLSFSRQVIKMHNGDISMWSRPGLTIFTLSFPPCGSV